LAPVSREPLNNNNNNDDNNNYDDNDNNNNEAILSKGIWVLVALSGSDWVWNGDLLRKVSQTSLLSGATYAGGEWLPWPSTSDVGTLVRAQNCNIMVLTGQLASTPNKALRLEAGVQSFGCLQDHVTSLALERSLRLNLESPRRGNFVEVPPPLSVLMTDQGDAVRYFREVFDWNLP
jgi:hypothetical protein